MNEEKTLRPRIAIPIPTSTDAEYNQRAWAQFAEAVKAAGGEPVEIPLDTSPSEIAQLATQCQGILLPGSPADVNPHKYGEEPVPECNPADLLRENVDELLLQDAHNLHKPILGVCYGTQSLNVWRTGSLVQHLTTPINHEAGRKVAVAHTAQIEPDSLLASIVGTSGANTLPVNSSHHQALGVPGDGLRVTARSSEDGVIEAVEDPRPSHFVLGVQWHPERTYADDPASKAIFSRLVEEARAWHPRTVTESRG